MDTNSKTANILFITPTDIDDGTFGGALRSRDLRASLCEVGDVDTLVIRGGHEFRIDENWNGSRTKYISYNKHGFGLPAVRQRNKIQRWIERLIEDRNYNAVVARYYGQAVFVPRSKWHKLIIDADDLHKALDNESSTLLNRIRLQVRNLIVSASIRRARHVWIVNPNDRLRMRSRNFSLLENAISLPDPVRPRHTRVPCRVLMVGFFGHPPNEQGLRFFVSEVLPNLRELFPTIEVHAVGKFPSNLTGEFASYVNVRGFVEDLSSEYDRASLVVAPIISGAGSQIKIIDALVHGRPVVASKFAHAPFEMHIAKFKHLLVAETPSEWVDSCAQILREPETAEEMAARGCEVAASLYGLRRMTERVQCTIRDIFDGDGANLG
jgi:glycosyltransferase involved in cell wall biosynthesis